MELEVWRGPAQGEPGAGTFRSYIAQIVQHALAPHPNVFIEALQEFIEALPPLTLTAIESFFPEAPTSISDPVAIVARHYLKLLREEASKSRTEISSLSVASLAELLEGFGRLVGPAMEHSDSGTVVLAFLALASLCDLRHQRRLCSESLATSLPDGHIYMRAPDGDEARFWAGCFFTLLEFSQTLPGAEKRDKDSDPPSTPTTLKAISGEHI